MDPLELASLAKQLLISLHAVSGYSASVALPAIHEAPLAEVRQRFCQAACPAQAFYRPNEGIVIDEALDLANDAFAQSILLHELVHHQQKETGRFQKILSDCDRWYASEREAYEIQNRFLESINSPHRVYVSTWQIGCEK
jgi:hypothetical protein